MMTIRQRDDLKVAVDVLYASVANPNYSVGATVLEIAIFQRQVNDVTGTMLCDVSEFLVGDDDN